MPYQYDQSDRLPEEKEKVFRYIDLGKLIGVLAGNLQFTCVEELAHGDPWENIVPEWHLQAMQEQYRRKLLSAGFTEETVNREVAKEGENYLRYIKALRRSTYASCWHINDVESAAMWSQYGFSGIAIQSSVKRLKDCFKDESRVIRIAEIDYINYEDQPLNIYRTYLTKRRSFVTVHHL